MPNVTFLYGFNKADGTSQILAGWAGNIHRFNSSTSLWIGLSQITSVTAVARMRTFLNSGFWVNGTNNNKRWDGTVWTDEIARKKAPLSKYIHIDPSGSQLFLANLSYQGQTFESRVWKSDLPKNNDITYGLEYGANLSQTASSPTVTSSTAFFRLRNIKVGDPFIILSGSNAGEYKVSTIDSETQITLTQNLNVTATGSTFWVGGNWFDVVTNNNDVVTGLGDNSSQVLIFKNESLHTYNGNSSRRIKGVPGTHSQESVVNIKEYTYYFHRTGIWRTNGVTAELISRPIQDYIDGIASSYFASTVAEKVGEIYRIFVGNVTNSSENIDLDNVILDFDTITETWSPGMLPVKVTATTSFLDANTETNYVGTDANTVYQDNIGTSDAGTAIPWMMDTGWHFPGGGEIETEITRIQIHNKAGRGIPVQYKLYGTPFDIDKQWKGLDDLSDEITEIDLRNRRDKDNIARGVALLLQDSSTISTPMIERIDIFWKPITARSI